MHVYLTFYRAFSQKSGIFESLFSVKQKFTSSVMMDLYDAVYNVPDLSHDNLLEWLNSKGVCKNVSTEALRAKLERCRIKRNKLRGKRKEAFLEEDFVFPAGSISYHAPSTSTEKQNVVVENVMLKSKNIQLTQTSTELKTKKKTMSQKLKRQAGTIITSKAKVARISNEKKLLTSEIKRSQKLLKKNSTSVLALKASNHILKTALKTTKERNKVLETESTQMKTKHLFLEEKNKTLQDKVSNLEQKLEALDMSENHLKMEKNELSISVDYLETLLNDQKEFSLFNDKRHLTNEAEMCIFNLLSAKVGIKHVGKVIQAVCKMFGKDIDRLPDEKTIRNVNDRMLALSLRHISDEFAQKEDTTLYTDETSKLGTKISGYHASDKEGNFWVLGLRELSNKSSQTTLDVFKEILADIDDASKRIHPTEPGKHMGDTVLSRIKNTMSDRAATEVAFNTLLADYRNTILPDVVDNWEDLAAEEKDTVSRMNNFFCGLHLLVGFAETAEKVVQKFESVNCETPLGAAALPQTKHFTSKSESGVTRTVRTTAKALARGADEKSGCYRAFKNFLNEINKKERLERFLGNRFNILFHDAEILFYLHKDIIDFLENVHGTNNLLLQAVLADVKEDMYIAGCKCLGLLSKLFTSPFWRLVESKGNILDMNDNYQQIVSFLQEASQDPSEFMTGNMCPFPDLVAKDHIYEALIKPDDTLDQTVHGLLMVIFSAWLSYIHKSVKDHLPDGKFSLAPESLKEECASAVRHNKFPERVFGLTDSLIRHRPNASEMCNESFIMFTNNKTLMWLEQKSDKEKARLLKDAQKFGSYLREQYKRRTKEIATQRMLALRKKQQLKEQQALKVMREKEKLTDQIVYYGLWQTKEIVRIKLSQITTKSEKETALKTQLKFRQNVLMQDSKDPSIFRFSKDKKKFSINELHANLETLVEEAYEITERESTRDNPLLTGKNVKHFFMENGQRFPYKGFVISTVPGFSNWYNIVYEEDQAVYTYKLLDDYAGGDLEILGIKSDMIMMYKTVSPDKLNNFLIW